MSQFKIFCDFASVLKTRRCLPASPTIALSIVSCAALLSPAVVDGQAPPPPTHRAAPWQPPTARWQTDFSDNFPTNAQSGQTMSIAPAPWETASRPTTEATPAPSLPQTNLANLRPPRDIFTQQTPPSSDRFAGRPLNESRTPAASGSGFDLQNAITEKFGSGIQRANLDSPPANSSFFGGPSFDTPRLKRFEDSLQQATETDGVTKAASTMAADSFDGVQNWVKEQTAGFLESGAASDNGWMQRLSSMAGGADIKKIGGSLAMVLGGYLGLVWLLRKINPAGNQSIPSEVLEVVGNAPLDSRQNLQLVRLGSKLLLMIHGPEGTQPIGEVTDPVEVDHLVALCNGKSRKANSAISHAVNRHQSNPANSGSLNLSSNQHNNLTQLLSALEQVNRGTSARTFEA